MAQVKKGDEVQVHYTGKLTNGDIFDTSIDGDPLQFTIGEGTVIPGFEQAIIGMEPGESKIADIPPDQGYGPRYENLVIEVDPDQLPAEMDPQVGQHLQIQLADGRTTVVKVSEISDESVKLDANHPLAGKTLTFDIQLVGII